MKKFLLKMSYILCFVLLLGAVACSETETPNTEIPGADPVLPGDGDGDGEVVNPNEATYTVIVKSVSGKPLAEYFVYFNLNGKRVTTDITDKTGTASVVLTKNIYSVEIVDDIPGYTLQQTSFTTTLESTTINAVADAYLITAEDIINEVNFSTLKYNVGDQMYDYTLTLFGTSEGESFSEILYDENGNVETELIVLNFWYVGCTWCVQEFPILEQVYKQIGTESKKVRVIAVNPGQDSVQDVQDFKTRYQLTFDFVIEPNMVDWFGIAGYPTTVFIDRYGTVDYMEEGALLTTGDWNTIIDSYLGDNYVPTYKGEDAEGAERVEPTYDMPESSEIAAVINGNNYNGHADTVFAGEYTGYTEDSSADDIKYNWPWIIDEDKQAIRSSNTNINNSFSMIYTTVHLEPGEVFAFDYMASCETDDILYVIINGSLAADLAGTTTDFVTLYALVSKFAGDYDIAFVYQKDSASALGDDCVYLKNLRILQTSDIEENIGYVRDAADNGYSFVGNKYNWYANAVLCEEDGLYHIDNFEGPLLLASINNSTAFSGTSLYEYATTTGEKHDKILDYVDIINQYATYASSSLLPGYVSINQDLQEALVGIAAALGQDSHANQWLELCVYYDIYGPTNTQMVDPIKGLGLYNAYQAVESTEEKEVLNKVTFDRVIVPRGLNFEFTPTTSGVYRIESKNELSSTMCWILNSDEETIFSYEENLDRANFADAATIGGNFRYYYYLNAGETYYIRPGFADLYEFDELKFTIKYYAESVTYLRVAAPSYFTTENDDFTGNIVSGGIDVYIPNGDLDEICTIENNVPTTNVVYADFANPTHTFAISLYDALYVNTDANFFDFTVDDENNEVESGSDMTEAVKAYYEAHVVTDTNSIYYGMVPMTPTLAGYLQGLMDKYSFAGVVNSWRKLCYYAVTIDANSAEQF